MARLFMCAGAMALLVGVTIAQGGPPYEVTLGADANLDGTVDYADLLAVAANFGSPGADWYSGDFNFDGAVDALDYVLLKSNFGQWVPSAEYVPEPATLALTAVGLLGLQARRRRQKR